MALIKCFECGKEVSDKAASCPNCGYPINPITTTISNEEYLCCPKCESKEIHSEQKGFSGGKALAGAILTGGIGILAGTIGSKDVQMTCLKCGNKFKAGQAKSVRVNQNLIFDYNDENIIKSLKEGNTNLALTYIQNKDKTLNAKEVANIAIEYSKRHNIEIKQPSGCLGLAVVIISVTMFFSYIL